MQNKIVQITKITPEESKAIEEMMKYLIKSSNRNAYKVIVAGGRDFDDYEYMSAKLNELFSHARLFVLPSFHEGLPIVLLEALSYRLPVLVSDIPANRLACLDASDFFVTGNIGSLEEKLSCKLEGEMEERHYDLSPYNWDYIASQVDSVYRLAKKPQ